ncbi:hypothetical protein PTTG_30427, partial [Puccinia triticina 1-1 BBBD Race 1]
MVNVEVAGALPKVKMVKIMPEDELLFDGSHVEEFIDAYEFAAGLSGASEYDKARQIILFIPHKSDARLILETLDGFESKDWPRLKAAMLSYWGRSKVPHVQEVNDSALIASVKDTNKALPTMEAQPCPEDVPASPRDSVTVEEVAKMFKQCEERLLKKYAVASASTSTSAIHRPSICYYCHLRGHGTARCHPLQRDKANHLVKQTGQNYLLPTGALIPFDPSRPIRRV